MPLTGNDIPELREGDFFYTEYDGRYHVYKLLKKDDAGETFHVLCYAALDEKPSLDMIDQLEINIYHAPIHSESFASACFLMHGNVTDDELIGYHEYLRRMENSFEEAISQATEYYKTAYRLTDEGKTEDAIAHYSKAIDLVPTFYEAIDNRAFCKMDLGRWRDAIEDFWLSLNINPGSLLAEFSIGECYYRLGEFALAKQQFEKCLELDPSHQVSRDCLIKSEEMMRRG